MFKKKTDKPVDAGTFTLQTEIAKNSPLTAAPADQYEFVLSDAFGNLDDEEWYQKRLDELSGLNLDETAGNYVDREIVAAMEASLKKLAKQRDDHVRDIMALEKAEISEAERLNDSIEDLLIKLEAAKRRYINIIKKGDK